MCCRLPYWCDLFKCSALFWNTQRMDKRCFLVLSLMRASLRVSNFMRVLGAPLSGGPPEKLALVQMLCQTCCVCVWCVLCLCYVCVCVVCFVFVLCVCGVFCVCVVCVVCFVFVLCVCVCGVFCVCVVCVCVCVWCVLCLCVCVWFYVFSAYWWR